jgi:type VI secretion system secreted protein Hcp
MPIYMKIEGVDGSVTAQGHERWIELTSVSAAIAKPAAGGRSTPSVSEIVVTKATDKSTTKLQQAVAQGTFYTDAILEFIDVSTAPQEPYLSYKLTNVLVTSYSMSGDGHSYPAESLSLNFTRADFRHTDILGDGSSQSGSWPGSR